MRRPGIAAAILLMTLLPSCGQVGKVPADTIRIAINSDIRGTNPGVDRDANTDSVLAHVVEGLVTYDEHLKIVPMLADTYSASDDGRSYTFHLRKEARFHNGAPVTSREVKWSWTRLLDPATRFQCRDWYDGSRGSKIVSIDTPDPRTVIFHLSQPNFMFLEQMANFQCVPAIIHPASVDASGRWLQAIGTGPYEIQTWQHGQYVLLKRFEGYRPRHEAKTGYGGAKIPYVHWLKWVVIPDPAAARAALLSGQIDLITAVQPADLNEIGTGRQVTVYRAFGLDWYAILLNGADPLLKDYRIRQAIAHAIDFSALARAGTEGTGRANPSAVPFASPYHSTAEDFGYRYDPSLARRLLKQAGYHGQPIILQANRRYQAMFDNAIIVQGMLRSAGFNIRLDVLEWGTQLANVPAGRFQLMSFGYTGRADPVFAYVGFLGAKTANPWMQWDDKPSEKLIADAAATRNSSGRQAILDALHGRMLAQTPILNLYNGAIIDVGTERLDGYRAWAEGSPRLWGVRLREGGS